MTDLSQMDEFLEQLKSGKTEKTKRSLDLINSICKDQIERGSQNLSIAMIGRLSTAMGGPSVQAIRNTSGAIYRTLINEWHREKAPASKKLKKKTSENSWIEEIERPNLKWHAEDLYNQFIAQRNELNHLKQITELHIDLRPPQSSSNFSAVMLTEIERRALEHCISSEVIERNHWQVDDRGQVLGSRNNQIFKPGFMSAIKKILESM
ncbi:MAG: gamma-mobile-trio protein GmtX [Cellvibrio sp.]|uniref:gamma-mobile-trio protein GmtX n=1 Tax=Cellvibrio sp. TaxID=1965322 RepID=UPI0031AC28B0